MVRVYWGSKRIQALGEEKPVPPYSAIVYKEGDEVRAEDWKGRTIASGEAGVDDASVIQSAINTLSSGESIVLMGEFYLKDSITINNKQHLHIHSKCKLVPQGDFPALIIDGCSHSIINGELYVVRGNAGYYDTSYGVRILNTHWLTIEALTIDRTRNGIEFDESQHILINRGLISVWGKGVYIYKTHKFTANLISIEGRTESLGPGYAEDVGILIEDSEDSNFQYLYVKYHTIGLKAVRSDLLSGLYFVFENNKDVGLYIGEGCTEAGINAAWAMGTPTGVLIEGSAESLNKYTRIGALNARYNDDINVIIGDHIFALNIDYIQTQKGNIGLQIDSPHGRAIHIGAFVPHQHAVADLKIVNAPAEGVNIDYIRHAWTGIQGLPANIRVGYGEDFKKSGTATFDGNGTTDDFSIGDHGLVITDPSKIVVKVTPVSSDAIAASPCVGYVDPADNTKIRVKFASAPASGSGNVEIVWEAQVVS